MSKAIILAPLKPRGWIRPNTWTPRLSTEQRHSSFKCRSACDTILGIYFKSLETTPHVVPVIASSRIGHKIQMCSYECPTSGRETRNLKGRRSPVLFLVPAPPLAPAEGLVRRVLAVPTTTASSASFVPVISIKDTRHDTNEERISTLKLMTTRFTVLHLQEVPGCAEMNENKCNQCMN